MFNISTGFRVAQIRAIFTLPDSFSIPEPLVYVKMFTSPQREDPIANIGMYRVRREMRGGIHSARVVPLSLVYRSINLLPMFGGRGSGWNWTSANVLEKCGVFYVNRYLDEHSFKLLY